MSVKIFNLTVDSLIKWYTCIINNRHLELWHGRWNSKKPYSDLNVTCYIICFIVKFNEISVFKCYHKVILMSLIALCLDGKMLKILRKKCLFFFYTILICIFLPIKYIISYIFKPTRNGCWPLEPLCNAGAGDFDSQELEMMASDRSKVAQVDNLDKLNEITFKLNLKTCT